MLRQTVLVFATTIAITSGLVACSKDKKDTASAAASAASSAAASSAANTASDKTSAGDKKDAKPPVKLVIAPEDVMTVQSNALASGPVVTGSIQPERKADLRAEVSAVVLQVLKENGDIVKHGDILVKLDETSIRDNLASAEDNARNAASALDQADRALQRLKTLRASGMTSMQAMDDAEVRRNSAQSELSASKARAVVARQQLQRTVVRAPFDGVVSERKVSAGDTASIGKELVKVIDPTSMRFAGRVSADKIAMVKTGQAVSFRINGYGGQEFRGKVSRVDPAANDVTRQVEVLVTFADTNQPRVSGLYAEGNIEAATVSALMLPEAAVVKSGDKSYAWKIAGKTLSKVDLQIGKRDQRTGNYEVRSGLSAGDIIMRNPSSNFKDGQSIEMAVAKVAIAAATSSATGNANATSNATSEGN
ncbi:efflux RND transporter periplasmic adaptor subunit [Undibacterium sp. RTI2.1]|uniref:efflux RND transporter periplasmic adaptor subunit n=1 Tax=unclassified Undibacterium TaxID=2630295 RepID=UPI002AB3AD60|nr:MULTISPECIES: efflux RND transporter periplasmic adaptor subunit [unclassified Undibacterium]MDY7539902.1 efflux RND transporter periplasmic adaptor subunit [Undibacterium sp. 5I1]MEB0031187.1 efflux RND transporter periplasmic adaptor subunit [Undibacterium sp. RTI2.1]MEB0116413.1 efflux RND transporter periplasmic adaptor subunit [Undibacterium sp. RTI2.2]MEB0230509.1 efflux RND transporter periplasmic adaptor subunit [Undibacterium sp. 10I3]MEB0257207.1 efflux RND transporter periplasmic